LLVDVAWFTMTMMSPQIIIWLMTRVLFVFCIMMYSIHSLLHIQSVWRYGTRAQVSFRVCSATSHTEKLLAFAWMKESVSSS
jgi:hypothetical protein